MNGRLRLAVTGRPIIHSKSPDIFKRIFETDSVSGFYTRIAADSIDDALRCSEIISLNGINVTSPFKEDAFRVSVDRADTAEFLNASNTLCFPVSGKVANSRIFSDNTDPEGVLSAVSKSFPSPEGLKAVVIGAGGAGAACCYTLSKSGFKTVMVNRTVEKARQRTADIKNCSAESLDNINKAVGNASLIVHTLPVSDYFFNPDVLLKDAVLFDANYKYSPLKKAALERGMEYIDGREWLLGQAEAAYRVFRRKAGFTGSPDNNFQGNADNSLKSLREKGSNEVSSDLIKNADSIFSSSLCFSNISLIGFMGCGKSAAGRKLSKLTGYDFIDTDTVIEARAGMSISELFEKKGESYFRKMEEDVLTEILSSVSRKIISCGGGVVGNNVIREHLKEYSLPVWLLAAPEVSVSRITDNSRPLLETGRKYEKAAALFNERIDLYGSASEMIINTETRDADKTAGRIYEEICEFL